MRSVVYHKKDVADFKRRSHAKWVGGEKADGSPRQDSSMRKFITTTDSKYRDNWDALFGG